VNGSNAGESLRVGFVLFVALVIATFGLYLVAFKPTVMGKMVTFRAYFSETSGLKVGAPVWLGGVEVGSVEDVGFTDPKLASQGFKEIEVTVEIQQRFSDRVREDSIARIRTQGLLGEKIVTISPGTFNKPRIEPGGVIPSEEGQDLEQAIATAGAGVDRTAAAAVLALEELRQILVDIRKQRGILGKLIYSDEFYRDTIDRVDRMIEEVRKELAALTKTVEQEIRAFRADASKVLNTLNDEIDQTGNSVRQATAVLRRDLEEAEALLKEIRTGEGTAALLVRDRDFARNVSESLAHLEVSLRHLASIMEKIDEGTGTVGKLVNDPSAYTSFRDLFEGVQQSWLLRDAVREAEATGRRLRIERWQEKSKESSGKKKGEQGNDVESTGSGKDATTGSGRSAR